MTDPRTFYSARRRAARIALAVVAFLPIASIGQPDSIRVTKVETAKATAALIRWFDCDSCSAVELKAVSRHGQAVVPILIAHLDSGMSGASRKALHDSLAARYDALDEQARKDPRFAMKSKKEEFIARYVDEYDARTRIRAAEALGAIGGTNARTALKSALAHARRPDVRKVIQESLQTIR